MSLKEQILDNDDPEHWDGSIHVPYRTGRVIVQIRSRFDPERGGMSLRLLPNQARKMAKTLEIAAKEAEKQR